MAIFMKNSPQGTCNASKILVGLLATQTLTRLLIKKNLHIWYTTNISLTVGLKFKTTSSVWP